MAFRGDQAELALNKLKMRRTVRSELQLEGAARQPVPTAGCMWVPYFLADPMQVLYANFKTYLKDHKPA